MRTEDYRRLRAVCLAMAWQSTKSPDVQARWFKLAEAWSLAAGDGAREQPSDGSRPLGRQAFEPRERGVG
jgi:hypothetical protein